jgi:hypothetical protein
VLVIGAKEISEQVFDGRIGPRAVYRLFETDDSWPVGKILNKWTGYKHRLRAEVARRARGEPSLRRTRP